MLRKIQKSDQEAFLALSKEFYQSDAVSHPVPESYHLRAFQEMMRSDAYLEGYIFELEGQIVGYALTAKTFSPEAGGMALWLEEVYIRPAFRSHGLGREFFEYVEALEGFARLRLEVAPENTRAIQLYERLGYQPLDYLQRVKDCG